MPKPFGSSLNLPENKESQAAGVREKETEKLGEKRQAGAMKT